MGAGETEREGEADEALLGAVVEISFEPAPLGVAGLDDARARGAQRRELSPSFRLQPLVLERETGGGSDLLDECRVVEQPRPVREKCHFATSLDDRCDLTLQLHRPSARIDESIVLERVDELERGVVQRSREGIPEGSGSRGGCEFDDETRERGTCPSRSHPRPGDPQRKREEGCRLAEPEPPIKRVVAEEPTIDAVCEVSGNKPEVGAPGEGDGGCELPPGWRRADQAGDDEQNEEHTRGETKTDADAVDGFVGTAVPVNEQQVAWTLGTALGGRIEDGSGEDAQDENAPGVGDRKAEPVEPRAKSAVRVGEHGVGDKRWGGNVKDEPGREDVCGVRSRVVPLDQEPGDRRPDEDRSEPGFAGARRCRQTDREERIAGYQLGGACESRAAADRVPRLALGNRRGERADSEPDSERSQPQRAPHAPIVSSPSGFDNRMQLPQRSREAPARERLAR